jgi:hypothetical protein
MLHETVFDKLFMFLSTRGHQRVYCSFTRSLFLKLWSTDHQGTAVVRVGFWRKSIAKVLSDIEGMKSAPIHACAKTAFVGWPLTESKRISFFYNFLSLNHYLKNI